MFCSTTSKLLIFLFILLPHTSFAKPKTELNCLAQTIYYEALDQSILGKTAVGIVIINRVGKDEWPNSICKVVNQYKYVNNRKVCQFSIWCQKHIRKIDVNSKEWENSLRISKFLLQNTDLLVKMSDIAYYHADYIKPVWVKNLIKVTQIGNHIFYKDKDNNG